MNAEQFVETLRSATPTEESLAAHGLDAEEIVEVQASFRARTREAKRESDSAGELGRLVSLFDCSSVEVGLVRFDPELTPSASGWRFGSFEADALVVNRAGEVVLCDHSAPDSPLLSCAATPERFLDALAVRIQVEAEHELWRGRVEEAARQCCEASGKVESLAFYEMLCSFLGGAGSGVIPPPNS